MSKMHTIAAKSLQQQSPSFPAKLKINDRVSSVHVNKATGNCKHEHVHGQNIKKLSSYEKRLSLLFIENMSF